MRVKRDNDIRKTTTILFISYDRIAYYEYKDSWARKRGKTKEEMEVLSILESLGYPMKEIGTYLYKKVIVKVAGQLKNVSTRREIYACRDLITQLKTADSQFYVDIARDDFDMDVASFHEYLETAMSKIDSSEASPALTSKIYDGMPEDMDYGENAFVLGSYVAGVLKPKEPDAPKVKML